MSNIQDSLAGLNQSARKLFGADISILIARAPAFGNDDVCFVVMGKRQAEVAGDLLRFVRGGKVTARTSEFMGHASTSTTVEGAAA